MVRFIESVSLQRRKETLQQQSRWLQLDFNRTVIKIFYFVLTFLHTSSPSVDSPYSDLKTSLEQDWALNWGAVISFQKSVQLWFEDFPSLACFCPSDLPDIKVLQIGRSGDSKVVASLLRGQDNIFPIDMHVFSPLQLDFTGVYCIFHTNLFCCY